MLFVTNNLNNFIYSGQLLRFIFYKLSCKAKYLLSLYNLNLTLKTLPVKKKHQRNKINKKHG